MKQITINKKTVLIAFMLFLLNAVALELGGKFLANYTHFPKLDFRINGYNTADVNNYFKLLGNTGREIYFRLNILDTPFPFLLAFFGFSYFTYTYGNRNLKLIRIFLISVSFSFMIFDTLENILIFRMLHSFPNVNEITVKTSETATQMKLYSLIIFYISLPITFGISIFRYFKFHSKKLDKNLEK